MAEAQSIAAGFFMISAIPVLCLPFSSVQDPSPPLPSVRDYLARSFGLDQHEADPDVIREHLISLVGDNERSWVTKCFNVMRHWDFFQDKRYLIESNLAKFGPDSDPPNLLLTYPPIVDSCELSHETNQMRHRLKEIRLGLQQLAQVASSQVDLSTVDPVTWYQHSMYEWAVRRNQDDNLHMPPAYHLNMRSQWEGSTADGGDPNPSSGGTMHSNAGPSDPSHDLLQNFQRQTADWAMTLQKLGDNETALRILAESIVAESV